MRASAAAFTSLKELYSYVPPEWAMDHFNPLSTPMPRLKLAHLPTPIYEPTIVCSSREQHGDLDTLSVLQKFLHYNVTFLIKRDDMTGGVELGGNKIRKLEFLLADALQRGCDTVVTIGGEQSNHCRATACAARALGLEPHVILRTPTTTTTTKPLGWNGNLLLDRMVGAHIYTCTPGEYGRIGSDALVQRLSRHLQDNQGKTVAAIPVGGSNAIGTWGYIEAVNEFKSQLECVGTGGRIDHVVFACGSGGTASGIALGLALCPNLQPQVHAVAVCDDPDYFYNQVTKIADEMGFHHDTLTNSDFVKQIVNFHQGKGLGYARSTPDELKFCSDFAAETGIILDPVYTGKALFHFVTHIVGADPDAFKGSTVLFWHTGGALGMYDKGDGFPFDDKMIRSLSLDDRTTSKDDRLVI